MGGNDEREQTLNQLLVEMDGFESNKGVIIMAATNRPEILDPALLRPGRFDRQILVDRPDINGREAILKIHTRKVLLSPEVDLHKIAARTPGFVGADLANLVNEAALLAARKNKEKVEPADFDEAIDRVVAGLEKKKRVMNPKEKEIIAFHESGHAIVAESVQHADPVHKISIIPRGIAALGYTQQQPTEDRYLMTRSELLDRLAVLLGGRVAEELVFGEISTGAQNDLQRATDIARSMVTEYGMSDRLGLVTYERERGRCSSRIVFPPAKPTAKRKRRRSMKKSPGSWRRPIKGCGESWANTGRSWMIGPPSSGEGSGAGGRTQRDAGETGRGNSAPSPTGTPASPIPSGLTFVSGLYQI